ncbi:MAG: response regulator [candidate division Zixibacteria bacterium]|nr:response regulator [candidate division Zixibacteria bacterium]
MKRLKVLLVDDEEELVAPLIERLKLRDYEAVGVLDGAEAIEMVKEREFDVVVLDVKMPGLGGLEVMRQIKAVRPDLAIILLTGRGSSKESDIGIEQGAYDYLIKPIDIKDLIRKMNDAVAASRDGGQHE